MKVVGLVIVILFVCIAMQGVRSRDNELGKNFEFEDGYHEEEDGAEFLQEVLFDETLGEETLVDSEVEAHSQDTRPNSAFQTKRNQPSFSKTNTHKSATLNSFQKNNKGSLKNMKPNSASFASSTTTSKPAPVKAQMKTTKPHQNTANGRSQNLNSRMANLEVELAQRMKQRQEGDALERDNKEKVIRDRRLRYSIPRIHATLVEEILHQYNQVHVNFYAMLGVTPTTVESSIKKQYRKMALLLHPDKNPHPDAKLAFDGLQDAYTTLTTTQLRTDYDDTFFRRQRYTQRKWLVWKTYARMIHTWWINCSSQWLVMYHQWKKGERIEDLDGWRTAWRERLHSVYHLAEHIVLLPSVSDRIQYVHSLWKTGWKPIVVIAYFLSCMFTQSS